MDGFTQIPPGLPRARPQERNRDLIPSLRKPAIRANSLNEACFHARRSSGSIGLLLLSAVEFRCSCHGAKPSGDSSKRDRSAGWSGFLNLANACELDGQRAVRPIS
jgi:hypothetical protein